MSLQGADQLGIDFSQQLEAKARILRDAIERIAKLAVPGEIVSWPSPRPYGYRVRARVASVRGRVGYRRSRSRELCATSSCPVLFPDLEEALGRLSKSLGPEHVECDFEMVADGPPPRNPVRSFEICLCCF